MKTTTKKNRFFTLAVCTMISLPFTWASAQTMNKGLQEKGPAALSTSIPHSFPSMNKQGSANLNSLAYHLTSTGGDQDTTHTGSWTKSDTSFIQYDANNRKYIETSMIWFPGNAFYPPPLNNPLWINGYMHTYNYFPGTTNVSADVVTQGTMQSGTNIWVGYMKYTYTYDGNNNPLTETRLSWSGTAFVNQALLTSTYTNNLIATQTYQTWSGTAWVNNSKFVFTYTGNNLTLQKLQTWNGSAWVDAEQYICAYDVNNNRTSETDQYLSGSTWVNFYKYTYVYTGNNKTSETGQSGNGSPWVNEYKATYTYNTNNNMSTELVQTWSGSAWINNHYTRFHYGTYDGIKEATAGSEQFLLYPNPVVNELNIVPTKQAASSSEKYRFEIMNVLGQSMYSAAMNEKSVVDMRNFPSGIYFVRMISDNAIITTKRVVKE